MVYLLVPRLDIPLGMPTRQRRVLHLRMGLLLIQQLTPSRLPMVVIMNLVLCLQKPRLFFGTYNDGVLRYSRGGSTYNTLPDVYAIPAFVVAGTRIFIYIQPAIDYADALTVDAITDIPTNAKVGTGVLWTKWRKMENRI